MTFRIGMKVERVSGETDLRCVDNGYPCPPLHTPCTVSNVFVTPDHLGTVQIELVEFPNPETAFVYAGFKACHFRPLIERKTSAGMEILLKLQDPNNHKMPLPQHGEVVR